MSYAHGIEENHIERMRSSEMRGSLECRISSSPEEWVAFEYRLSNGVLYEFASREDGCAGRHRRALDLADVIKVALQGRDERTFRISMRDADVHLRARNEEEAREWAFGFHHSIVLLVERLARSQRQHLRVSRARRSTQFSEAPGVRLDATLLPILHPLAVEREGSPDRNLAAPLLPPSQAAGTEAQPIAARMLAHRAGAGPAAATHATDAGAAEGVGRRDRQGTADGAFRRQDPSTTHRGLSSSMTTGGLTAPPPPSAWPQPRRQGGSAALEIRREAMPPMRRERTHDAAPRRRKPGLRKSSLSAQLEGGGAAGPLPPSVGTPRAGMGGAVEAGVEGGSTRAETSGPSSPVSRSCISGDSTATGFTAASPPSTFAPRRAASDGGAAAAAASGGAYMPPWLRRKMQQEQAAQGNAAAAVYVPPWQRRQPGASHSAATGGGAMTGARLLEQWEAEAPAGMPTEEERTTVVQRTVTHADGRQEHSTVTATAAARGITTADGRIAGLRDSAGHAVCVSRQPGTGATQVDGEAADEEEGEKEEDGGRYAARENGFYGVLTTKGSKIRNEDRYVVAVRVGAGLEWEPVQGAEHEDVSEAARAYTESLPRCGGRDSRDATGAGDHGGQSPCSIFCVFDGHCGARASEFAAAALPAALTAHRHFGQDQQAAVREAFLAVDDAFLEHAREHQWNDGTTAIVVVLRPRSVLVANLGDCRAVLARGGNAVELSQDHTPKREQERIEIAGGWIRMEKELFLGRLSHMDLSDPAITVKAKKSHWVETYRVNGELAVSRALGDFSFKGRGLAESEWHFPTDHPGTFQGDLVLAECEVSVNELQEEDEFIIIACDGLWDVVSSQLAVRYVKDRIRDHLQRPTPQFACDELVRLALRLGTGDNVTAIVIMPGEQEQAVSSTGGGAEA